MQSSRIRHVAVCIPAREEAGSLKFVLPELDEVLVGLPIDEVSIFVFNDGSQDETSEVVTSTQLQNANLFLIQSLVCVGKAVGLQNCMSAALDSGADVLIIMDADGQDDPAYIELLLQGIESGLDVVNGRRRNRAHSLVKKWSSRAFNAAVRFVSGQKIWDLNSGFKAFSKRGAQVVVPYLYGELHRVVVIIAVWLGLSVGEVPVLNRPRIAGRSKYGFARGWRGFFDLITIQFLRHYHNRPGHFFSGVSFALIFLGAITFWLGSSLLSADQWFDPMQWAGLVLLGFGLVFLSFGFLSELGLFLSKGPRTFVTTLTRVEMAKPDI